MRKIFTSVFLVGLLGMAWNSAWAQDDDRLSFGVISDIHIASKHIDVDAGLDIDSVRVR